MRVPAEWEPLRAIWIAWPHNHETWPGRFAKIPAQFRALVELIAESHRVNVIGAPALRESANLGEIANVNWFDVATNDCWIRDFGPTYVIGDSITDPQTNAVRNTECSSHTDSPTLPKNPYAIDWRYNAWGGKYPPWDDDDAAARQIAKQGEWNCVQSDLCIEGGALEWDGTGRLMTTSSCLFADTRNPDWSVDEIKQHLHALTGVREMILVDGGGLEGDDTDGHIDQLARFIDPENVVVASSDNDSDANSPGLKRNHEILMKWGQTTSPRVKIHSLPIPPPRYVQSQRVPESYCNFLRLGAEKILVPTFGNPITDHYAIGLLRELAQRTVANAEVIGVDCRDLVWGLGALHCASLNEPVQASMNPCKPQ